MIYFTDHDIIRKLAAFDLLDEATACASASESEIYVVSSFKYAYGKPGSEKRKKQESKIGASTVRRIIEFLEGVHEITEAPLPAELDLLKEVQGIDDGEAILLASTRDVGEFRVLTGDKRCIRTLSGCARLRASR